MAHKTSTPWRNRTYRLDGDKAFELGDLFSDLVKHFGGKAQATNEVMAEGVRRLTARYRHQGTLKGAIGSASKRTAAPGRKAK